MATRLNLPFGSEFSPSQIDLPMLLELVSMHDGDTKGLQTAIQKQFFSKHGGGNASNQKTLAMNCRLGLKAYGLIDSDAHLTDVGRSLVAIKGDERRLYESLARHILLHLNGMALIQCIRDMMSAAEKVNLTSLRAGLAERGVDYPSGGKAPSMMRLWLEKAGVFADRSWRIDESRTQALLGTDPGDFSVLSSFTAEQRAFLLALANSGVSKPQAANEITKLASATYGVKFPEKSLPKLVLNALEDAGYIREAKHAMTLKELRL